MGFKTACIMTGDCPPHYFGTLPEHNPERADQVLPSLGYEQCFSRESSELEIYPDEGKLFIGAYEKALYIADRDIIYACFEDRSKPYFQNALKLYPEGKLLIVVLHSVVNYFGYAYYEKGKLLREYSGSGDDGVLSEIGELQPEEKPAFERSEIRDGERIFFEEIHGETEEFDVSCYGESLAFMMMTKFFDCELDRSVEGKTDPFDLKGELMCKTTPQKKPPGKKGLLEFLNPFS